MIALSPSSPQSRRRVEAIREHFQGSATRLSLRGVVLVGAAALCCLALLVSWRDSDSQSWAGSPAALLKAKTWASLSTGSGTHIKIASEAQDDAAYFVEKGVTPASWTRTFNPPTCVHEYVTRKGLLNSTRPLDEWNKSFATESGCPSYPIPKGGFLFHLHWEGPWSEELEVSIDSFLATQRLSAGHKIVFWYGRATPPPQDVMDHYLGIAPDNVEFRILDRLEESKGTCLTSMPDWMDEETRMSKNMKPASLSNLSRLLLLTKYGGVWVDSDVVFVRDLSDMLRVGPLAPAHFPVNKQQGYNSYHFYNNHIYVVGQAPSPVAERMLETACGLSYGPDNWPEQFTFKPHAGRVFNDGLLQICERVTHCGLSAFPLALVESETWTPAPVLKPCLAGTTNAEVDAILQRVWMWHFRNECSRYGQDDTFAYEIVKRRVQGALSYNLEFGLGRTLPGAE